MVEKGISEMKARWGFRRRIHSVVRSARLLHCLCGYLKESVCPTAWRCCICVVNAAWGCGMVCWFVLSLGQGYGYVSIQLKH